tara:strand:+ start:2459 stop:3310 length:852 start_codon:yes stop_codon:yes gene_type:complete
MRVAALLLVPLVAAVLALPALAEPPNSALIELDRRDEVMGWEAVGRVDIGRGGFCTGTLIATDLVLTAAHCLFDPDGAPVDPRSIVFRAGLRGENVIATGRVIRAVAHPAYAPGRPATVENIRHDVALLELSEPIPAARAAPFAVQEAGTGGRVSVVSYARGRADAPAWQRVCQMTAKEQGLLRFDCDVTFGSSGAPVFDLSGRRATIVSVVSSGLRDGDKAVAYGMELPALVQDLKAALNSGKGVLIADGDAPLAQIRRIVLGGGTAARNVSGAKFLRVPTP